MIISDENKNVLWTLIFCSWLVACVAMAGSLFFSEVMRFPPCVLCWYQRICMYPLVAIFLVGLFPLNLKVLNYSLPLVTLGWSIALYHNLLHYGIIPESASPCQQGVSCATVYINLWGFLTIPLLSFIAFTLILFLLTLFYKKARDE